MTDLASTTTSASFDVQPPRILICVSGKRKSGKDFVATRLRNVLQQNFLSILSKQPGHRQAVEISVCGISFIHRLKENFAKINGLDSEKLKTDDVYKEVVRKEMVKYGEGIRTKDPGFFCRSALQSVCCSTHSTTPDSLQTTHVVIVSDCRRLTDLAFFQAFQKEHASFPPLLIRVESSVNVRKSRGFVFTPGIDDAETECALDKYDSWDFCIANDGNQPLDEQLNPIINCVLSRLFSSRL